jgi:hypothetical protein
MICCFSLDDTSGGVIPAGPTPPTASLAPSAGFAESTPMLATKPLPGRFIGEEQLAVDGRQTIGHRHLLLRDLGKRPLHELHPDRQRKLCTEFTAAERLRLVVAHPRDRHELMLVTREPAVLRVVGRTGLALQVERLSTLVPAPVPPVATECSRLFMTYALRGSSVCGALLPAISGLAREITVPRASALR